MKEITVEQLHNLPSDSYELIDIRDDGLVEYGMIPGAIHIDLEELEKGRNSKIEAIAKDKKLILYCEIGRRSREIEGLLCFEGRECLSLEGGYVGYIRSGLKTDLDNGMTQKNAE